MNREDSDIERTLCGFGEGVFLLTNLPRDDVTRLGVCLDPQQGYQHQHLEQQQFYE